MMTSASAEENEYVPLVREGVVWEYVGDNQGDYWSGANTDHYNLFCLYTLEFNGTTTIDGKLYHNIYRTDYDEQGNAQEPFFVAYVREENKVVTVFSYTYEEDDFFFYNYWWWMPKTLYDFNKAMFLPDEAFMAFGSDGPYNYNTDHVINGFSSIEVEVGGTIRKGFFIDNDEDSFKTIEGIGVDGYRAGYPLSYLHTDVNPILEPAYYLSHVVENGEIVYKSVNYGEVAPTDGRMPIVRDGVQWVNEKVIINNGDTTRYYYTYEISGVIPTDGFNAKKCHYYTGEKINHDNDSIISKQNT